jgi:parallel beta-helix repeat protein
MVTTMHKQTALILVLITLTALFTALTQLADGANGQIVVPINYPSIQEAINHANAGGTVFVKRGIYQECISIDKPLTLLAENGATILGGWQQGGTIVLVNHDNVTISGFAIQSMANGTHGNSIRGVHLLNVQGCTVSNCSFSKGGTAIWLYGSSGNTIENNAVDGREQYIGNCLVYTYTGLSIQHSSNNIVRHNTLNDITESGIELTDSHGNTIDENNLKCQWKDLNLAASENNTIKNNNIRGGRFGIQQNTASHNQIENNTFTDAYTTIQANDGSCYNLFTKNNIIASKYCGIELHQNADHNNLIGNNIERGANGIEIKNSANNTLTYNNITGTSLVGVIMVNASNNLIQKNNFIENTQHVSSSASSNTWDANGKGNYWDTYNATDAGDSQYVINESNIDHFPLIEKASPTILEIYSLPPSYTEQPNMTTEQNAVIIITFGILIGALALVAIGLYLKRKSKRQPMD